MITSSLELNGSLVQVVAMAQRRHPDHFSRKARQEGYAARSVYKLQEIDKKHRLFRSGQRVLDLGCAPGSWLKFIARKVGMKGRAGGIDRTFVTPMAPNVTTMAGDIFETPVQVLLDLAQGPYDVITSDMAPDTTGNRFTDHVRSVELCRRALEVSLTLLSPGGAFVCKIFEGEDVQGFVAELRAEFDSVKRVKPKSTRSQSVEFFLVGLGKKGSAAEEAT